MTGGSFVSQVQNKQILVLGLDGAGKTSVLHLLASNTVQHSTAPTQGFNAVHIDSEDRKMEFLESKFCFSSACIFSQKPWSLLTW